MTLMRVVVLDHTAKEGGAELALLRLAQRLRADDDADLVAILFADGAMRVRLRAAGIPTVVLPLDAAVATTSRNALGVRAALRSAMAAVVFVPRLVRAIRGARAELVVANSLKSAVFAAVAAPLAGRRWVWHLHDRLAPDYLSGGALAAMRLLALLGPKRIVVNSRATCETLPGRARAKASIAYPGLADEAFETPTRRPLPPVVGIVGRLSPTKGQREFLEAASKIAARHPSARFRIIGDALFGEDEYAAALADLARDRGIGDRTEFTGWVDDPLTRMAELSLIVHASPVPEPFGQVVAEAMALGVPVVATAAGGVPEILDGGGTGGDLGLLVAPGDVDALAAAMDSALTDPEAAEERALRARRAAERFRIDATAAAVRDVWNAAAARHPASANLTAGPARPDDEGER